MMVVTNHFNPLAPTLSLWRVAQEMEVGVEGGEEEARRTGGAVCRRFALLLFLFYIITLTEVF